MTQFYIVPSRKFPGSVEGGTVVTIINGASGAISIEGIFPITVMDVGQIIEVGIAPNYFLLKAGDTCLGNLNYSGGGGSYGVGLLAAAADPTQNAAGALYFNTVDLALKYYNGVAWVDVGVAGSGISSLSAAPGITLTPNPIILTGTIGIDFATNATWTGMHSFTQAITFASVQTFVIGNSSGGGLTLPGQAAGDMIFFDTVPSPHQWNRLPLGTLGFALTAGSSAPAWSNVAPVVELAGSVIGQRPTLNFIDGINSNLTISDNGGQNRIDITVSANSGPQNLTLRFMHGYTPIATGPDEEVLEVAYDPGDGVSSITYNILRITFRVETAGSTTSTVIMEKSVGGGVFTPVTVDTLSVGSGVYSVSHTGGFAASTLISGDVMRVNVSAFAIDAARWSIQIDASEGAGVTNYSPPADTTPFPVASVGAAGSYTTISRADHIHEGVHSLLISGESFSTTEHTGDLIFAAGSNITLTRSGINLRLVTIAGTGSGVTSLTAGTGLSAAPSNPITTTGTLSVDQSFSPTWTGTHAFTNPITFALAQTFVIGNSSGGGLTIAGQNTGDLIYYTGTKWDRLAASSDGKILGLTGGIPAWGAPVSVPGARATYNATTISLANNATDSSTYIGIGKGGILYSIATDRAARVRFYTDATRMATDVARLVGVVPAPNSGLVAEVITTGAQTILLSPLAVYANLDSVIVSSIPMAVTNNSGSMATVTVSAVALTLEA